MKSLKLEIWQVSIFGFLPCFMLIIFILSMILAYYTRRKEVIQNNILLSNNKILKNGVIYEKKDYLSFVLSYLLIGLFIIPVIAIIDAHYITVIEKMLLKIEVIGSTVIGITTMAITLSVAIALFNKSYYIVFSIRDVLQKYKFLECLMMSILSCIIVCVMLISLLNQKLLSVFAILRFCVFEIFTIYNILFNTYLLFLIVYIMFSDKRIELKILEQLYRRFWIDRVDNNSLKRNNKWMKEDIEINVEYLVKKYINICKKRKISNIDYIEFITTMGINKKKWYKDAKFKFICTVGIMFMISSMIDVFLVQKFVFEFIAINTIATVIMVMITLIQKDGIYLIILRIVSATKGYYLHTNNNKEKIVSKDSIFKNNIYHKFVTKMNSLNAFFYIWLNDINDDNYKYIEYIYRKVIESINLGENKNIVIYMPTFIIGFFMFEKNIKSSYVKLLYKEMVDINTVYTFQRMIFSQVVYLTRNNNKSRENLKKYFLWLKYE